MEGPQDGELTAAAAVLDGETATTKVEQRLALFELERGLQPEPMTPPEPGPRRRGARTPAAEEVGAERADPEFASRYIQTVSDLLADGSSSAPERAAGDSSTAADAALLGPSWRSIGPTDIPNGQTYGSGAGSRVNVSGRIATLAVDPANPNRVLAGSAGGGIWETTNNGASWSPRTDQQPTLTTGAIAYDRSAPATVYALTGEGNFYWRLGAGLLRSVNGGTTWTVRASAPFVGQGGYDLLVDPGNSTHLLAATTGGLYESTDSGLTWTQRRARLSWDLSMHPTTTSEVLAACSDGVYQSTNGGQTWTQVTLPGAPTGWSRIAVAHAPSSGAVAYVFAASGATAYLWRRDTSGTWSSQTLPGISTGQAWYDWYVAVAPDNANQVYLGEIHLWRGDLSGTSWTWLNISSKNPGSSIHPDQHAIAFRPGNGNVVWAGNDGGVFRSDDRGITWTACNTGIGITEIEYMAQNRGLAHWLLAGTQDNGTLGYTGSFQWPHVQDGDGGDCAVDSATPTTVFHTFFNMGMERSTQSGAFGTWQWRGPNVPNTYRSLFYPPVEGNSGTVGQAGQSLFISVDDAGSFTEVVLGFTANGLASAMDLPAADRVLVGSTSGDVVRVVRSGTTWTATSLTRPAPQGWVSDLTVDRNNANRIWATYTSSSAGRVYRSDNGGSSWTNVTAGLPNLPINAVEVDPWNSNRAWVAADVGVWQTLDAGAHWASFGSGLPNALAVDLVFHPHARLLRAATRNRGVFEIDIDDPAQFPICGTQWTGSLTGGQTQRWFTFNWPATWHVIWTVLPTSVRRGSPQVRWNVEVERASAEFVTYWITVVNLTPDPVTFEGRYAILSRH